MYYTPTLDEFHSGFECEIRTDVDWQRCTLGYRKTTVAQLKGMIQATAGSTISTISLDEESRMSNLRVKYLDAEDIERLGFHRTNTIGDKTYFNANGHDIALDLSDPLPCLTIINEGRNSFYGKVRNINEFKRLLQQLEIPYVEDERPFFGGAFNILSRKAETLN